LKNFQKIFFGEKIAKKNLQILAGKAEETEAVFHNVSNYRL
jgi:hypothetical protein